MNYVVLTGKIKDFGDHLIGERVMSLLRTFRPDRKLFEHHCRQPVDRFLKQINNSKALILSAGPAYAPNIYPGIFPLVKNLARIRVPIVIFGIGWRGYPHGDPLSWQKFKFTLESQRFLDIVHSGHWDANYRQIHSGSTTGCRDYLAQSALRRNGYYNVLMTGDPAAYDLELLDQPFMPVEPETVAFSFPQAGIYFPQSVETLKRVKAIFHKARIVCTFHRGIKADRLTNEAAGAKLERLADIARGLVGKKNVFDISYGIEKGERLYNGCDLHVGYRVHGHIWFLSKRKPSFLLEEDGRGRGLSETIGLRGVAAGMRKGKGSVANTTAPEQMEWYVRQELENGFLRFRGLHEVFKGQFQTMKRFLALLP